MNLMETLMALVITAVLLMAAVPLYVSYVSRNQLLEQKRTELIESRSTRINSSMSVEAGNDDSR